MPRLRCRGLQQTDYPSEDAEVSFNDVELFLAEHDLQASAEDLDVFPEKEAAEVLAASWKDSRRPGSFHKPMM